MSRRPHSNDIAAYAHVSVTFRNCAAKPGYPCTGQAELWRTVCRERFADAAAVYVPLWKAQQRHRRHL